MIEITAPSRIHMALIDLNASIGRVDGGIGITLQEPAMRIRAEISDCDGIIICGQSEHAQRMHDSAQKVSDAFKAT